MVIGLDPGASGGIAWIVDGVADCRKMPETERDIWELLSVLRLRGGTAFIERVHSMPKQGVASSFKFGQQYGTLRGMLIGSEIPFEEVTPQRWQKALGCLTKGDKNVSKAKAQQLFPHLKITHAVADALLIAEYARRIRTPIEPAPAG
jgi:crossover junction endodeoxyribonuclease RuvC